MAMKFILTGVTDRKGTPWGKDRGSELPNQYLEILMYPSEEWAVGSGKYFAKGICAMDFTFEESEEKFLAKQPNGIPFVLEPLKDAGSIVGYVLRYPEKSNTFVATFRAHKGTKKRRKKRKQPRKPELSINLVTGSRKPSTRSLGIPGESPRTPGGRRRTTAVLSTARNSADDMALTPESRQGTCTAIESMSSGM